MKTITMIVALCMSAASLFGGTKVDEHFKFIVVLEDGMIKVCDTKGLDLGKISIAAWLSKYDGGGNSKRGADIKDAARHVVLDAVAAFVAGGGARDHTVWPDAFVVTFDEAGTTRPVTLTLQGKLSFYILRDSEKPCGDSCEKGGRRYRAEIGVVTAEEMDKARADKQNEVERNAPLITSQEAYDALPDGTVYRENDGMLYAKQPKHATPPPAPAKMIKL
jgi:hypothetical protein